MTTDKEITELKSKVEALEQQLKQVNDYSKSLEEQIEAHKEITNKAIREIDQFPENLAYLASLAVQLEEITQPNYGEFYALHQDVQLIITKLEESVTETLNELVELQRGRCSVT